VITGGNGPLSDDVGGLLPDEPDSFTNLTVDLAVRAAPTFSLGDVIWLDTDGDGKYTAGVDTPVPGVTVQVLDAEGNVVGTATTDANGRWAVTDLPPGTYHALIPPSEFAAGGPLAGAVPVAAGTEPDGSGGLNEGAGNNNAPSGDVTLVGLASQPVTFSYVTDANGVITGGNGPLSDDVGGLLPDEPDSMTNLTVDLALRAAPTFSLGDIVWLDADGDGKYTAGVDTPVSGVPVQILDAEGNVAGTATTDASGRWAVTDLPPGTYHAFIPASAFAAGGSLAGTLPVAAGTEPDASGGVNEGGGNNNAPSGDVALVGLASQPVTLAYVTDANGVVTGGNGPSNDDVGGLLPDEPDSMTNLTLDLAVRAAPTFSLGDVIWLDKDGDGKYTAGVDTPVSGVPVQVLDAEGNVAGTATTDANGRWVVSDLPPGTYHALIPPSAFAAGGPLAGTVPVAAGTEPDGSGGVNEGGGNNNAPSGDVTQVGLASQPVTLAYVTDANGVVTGGNGPLDDDAGGLLPDEPDSMTNLTLDLAVRAAPTFSYGDLLWLDADGDGKYTAGVDTPLVGVPVQVIDDEGNVVGTATTDENGRWVVSELPPGTYHALIPPSAFAPGGPLAGMVPVAAGTEPDGSGGLNEGAGNNNAPSGDVTLVGLASQPVTFSYVTDANGVITGGNGPLSDDVGGLLPDEPDSMTNLTGDLAVRAAPTFSLGDIVWLDADGDGKYTAGVDTPVAGVPIQVLDAEGNVVGTATTDENGRWVVSNLLPGTYHAFIPPSAFASGGPLAGTTPVAAGTEPDASGGVNEGQGNNNAPSGDASLVGLTSQPVTLAYVTDANGVITGGNGPSNDDVGGLLPDEPDSMTNLTLDLAVRAAPTFSLGDVIWLDKDGDGKYTAGVDTPVPGVTVQVLDAEGNVVGTATTDANGRWVVSGLLPGTYHAFIPPSAFSAGGPLAGTVPVAAGTEPNAGGGVNEGQGNNNAPSGDVALVGLASQPVTLEYVRDANGVVTGGNGPLDDDEGDLLPDKPDSLTNLTLDLAVRAAPTFSLGDVIWLDKDGDGKYTAGVDTPVAGVPVQVLDAEGNVVGTATTDANGRWVVSELPAGTYHAHIPSSAFGPGGPLAGTTPSPQGQLPGSSGQNEGSGNKNAGTSDPTVNGMDSVPVTLAYLYDEAGNIIGGNGPMDDDVADLLPDAPDSYTNLTVDLSVQAIVPPTTTPTSPPVTTTPPVTTPPTTTPGAPVPSPQGGPAPGPNHGSGSMAWTGMPVSSLLGLALLLLAGGILLMATRGRRPRPGRGGVGSDN